MSSQLTGIPERCSGSIKYSAIIGVYNGINNVSEITNSLLTQSVKPEKIISWSNNRKAVVSIPGISSINCTENFGCFSRFSASFLCSTSAIMVLDDDTIPGKDWAKNCIQTMEKLERKAILGCRGIILKENAYYPFREAGIDIKNDEIQECDLVGHSWFFMRKHAHFLFSEMPLRWDTGEDIHFSAVAKKNGIRTFCPPHPKDNKNFWGSTKRNLGNTPGRISTSLGKKKHFEIRGSVVKHEVSLGWKPLFCSLGVKK